MIVDDVAGLRRVLQDNRVIAVVVKIEYARLFGGLNYAGVNTRIISAKRPPCPPLMG